MASNNLYESLAGFQKKYLQEEEAEAIDIRKIALGSPIKGAERTRILEGIIHTRTGKILMLHAYTNLNIIPIFKLKFCLS